MWDSLRQLVLLQLVFLFAGALQVPRLEITFPAQHSWWQVSNSDGLLASLPVYFQTHHFQIPKDGFLFVTGDNVPNDGYQYASETNSLILSGIDPGTHFWKFELIRLWNDNSTAVAEAALHVEVVVNVSDENSPWRYKLRESEKRPSVLVNLKSPVPHSDEPLPVCFVMSTSAAFDGQRRMWLQIMEGLSIKLQYAVKTFEKVVADAPMTRALRQLNVSLDGLLVEIPRNELSEEEASRDGVVEVLLASFYRQFPTARLDSRQVSKLDQPALQKLRPPFAARIWTNLVEALNFPCSDGIIVFSNSRSISDELLVLATRLTGTRAVVMELANLHPTRVDVDILLAPSHFAKEHYSVARNVRARSKIVLATGVDTQQFAPSPASLPEEDHFVIGYVGRLSSEKSLGILLATMKILAPLCGSCRLRVVGDGQHKTQLQSIAAEWGLLGTSVEFVDGIYNDAPALVRTFREMHVFASPMFPETLGLAVLEAMSVGLPVVGFISGGTTEFLEDSVNCLAVTKATPATFANALLKLANDNELRLRLGRQARRTVVERFSICKTLEQYGKLYERVGRKFTSRDIKLHEECVQCTGEFCGLSS